MSALQKKTSQNMITGQILTNKVHDQAVIEALETVNREDFVADSFKGIAYIDNNIPLGGNRFLTEPLALARMLETTQIKSDEKVLVVACASGYGAAVIAKIAKSVIAIEEDETLVLRAKELLVNCTNLKLFQANLTQGLSIEAPYDAIIIDGGVEVIPQTLLDQLKIGGRLVTIEKFAETQIGNLGLGRLVKYEKHNSGHDKTIICDVSVNLLPHFAKKSEFVL